jgi:hypothetical protein
MGITKITNPDLFDLSTVNTSLRLPNGGNLTRPTSPSQGEWRYNTDLKYVEFWDGAAWVRIETDAIPPISPSEFFNANTYRGLGITQTESGKFNEAGSFYGETGAIASRVVVPLALFNDGALKTFTVSLWFRTDTKADEQTIFGTANASSATGFSLFLRPTDGYLRYAASHAGGSSPGMEYQVDMADGDWHNVVATYSSAGGTNDAYMYLYVDGVDVTAPGVAVATDGWTQGNGSTWSSFTTNKIVMGVYAYSGGNIYPHRGQIDQVRVYTSALASSDAIALNSETITTASTLNFPSGQTAAATYQLDGDTSDLSGNYPAAGISMGYTGTKFMADMSWIKGRDASGKWNVVYDSIRGATNMISTNESNSASSYGSVTFLSSGITIDGSAGDLGTDGVNYVAWNFKAGGAPTATNSAGVGAIPTAGSAKINGSNSTANLTGSIAATKLSANTLAGFSMVAYEGNGLQNATVDTGLESQANLVIIKNLDGNDAWFVGSTALGTNELMELNSDADAFTNANLNYTLDPLTIKFTGSSPHDMINKNGSSYIMYSFQNVNGYNRVDTYTGDGSEYGPIIYTTSDGTSSGTDGFEPAFVMIKCTNFGSGTNWVIFDNKRNLGNLRRNYLYADSDAAESTAETLSINFYSNGFQPIGGDGTHNGSGKTYLYLAVAADPYTATPSATNSFGITLNTDPALSEPVVNTLKPESAWTKGYTNSAIALSWGQYDLLRGSGVSLQSDNTGAEYDYYYHGGGNLAMLFSDNGYIQPPVTNNNLNNTSHDYISYFWALGGKQTINNDGTSTSVVTANAAAGCSIGLINQPDTTARNFGHGLDGVPEMMIIKTMTSTDDWNVYHSALGNTTRISMNTDAAKVGASTIWDSTTPTSEVFYLQDQTGGYHLCYFFRSVTGVQSVGSYEGNQATGVDNQIDFGFAPRFVLIKNADSAGSQWMVFDSARTNGYALYVNGTGIEVDYTADLTLSSQGLRFGSTNINVNQSGDTYIYLAIA